MNIPYGTKYSNVIVVNNYISSSSMAYTGIEGTDITLTVRSNIVPGGYTLPFPCTVTYSTIDGTAINGVDYTGSNGSFTWPAGDIGDKNIVIHLNNDGVADGNKSFTVTLSNPVNATLGVNTTCTVTILDAGAA